MTKPQHMDEHNIPTNGKLLIKFVIAFVLLGFVILFIAVFLFLFRQPLSSTQTINSTKFGEFGSFMSGAVGVLWSLVGVILFYIALQLQRKELSLQREELSLTREELKKSVEANRQIAEDTKANAIVDLYQTFTNDYFFKLKSAAWNVLMNCLASKEYSDYLISTFFVSDFSSEINDENKDIIYKVYGSDGTDDDKKRILTLEHKERHELEDFINFYGILALRDAPKEVFEQCDFFYEWWRPLLWWICDKRLATYIKDEEKIRYSTKPQHLKTLKRLDFIYGFETLENPADRWHYFLNHPIVKRNRFDQRHKDPYL